MKRSPTVALTTAILSVYGLAFVGCNTSSSNSSTSAVPATAAVDDDHDHSGHDHDDHDHDDHDHDDHDHDDHGAGHDDHDHPAHGPNGGHLVELGGDSYAEWVHDDEEESITVYTLGLDDATKVLMTTTVQDETTEYAFEKKEVEGEVVFQLVSPELLTAVKMGKVVDPRLVISTGEGDLSGQVQYHAH